MILEFGYGDEAKKIRAVAAGENGRLWDQHWEVIAASKQKVIAKDLYLVLGIAKAVGLTCTTQQFEGGAG